MAKYTRAHHAPAPRQTSTTSILVYIIVAITLAAVGTIAGFRAMILWPALSGVAPSQAQATNTVFATHVPSANSGSGSTTTGQGETRAAPTASLFQIEATSQAIYQATAAAAAEGRVDRTGDSAPLIVISKSADRQPAGENVPTAEPLPESNDQFGSKEVIVAPQESHTCRHAQVWTDSGCKNPTPVQQ